MSQMAGHPGIGMPQSMPGTQVPATTYTAPQQDPYSQGASSGTPSAALQAQQVQQLQNFWNEQIQEIEQINEFKNHQLPLARIKKIMKSDEDVRMISAEAPVLFSKACEMFILELTLRSWIYTEENKRRTLQRSDIAAAISKTDIFDFLIDIVPREDAKPSTTKKEEITMPMLPPGAVSAIPGHMQAPQATSTAMMPRMGESSSAPTPGHSTSSAPGTPSAASAGGQPAQMGYYFFNQGAPYMTAAGPQQPFERGAAPANAAFPGMGSMGPMVPPGSQ